MPDRSSKPKRPRDTNLLAGKIVDLSTGKEEEENPRMTGKIPLVTAACRNLH